MGNIDLPTFGDTDNNNKKGKEKEFFLPTFGDSKNEQIENQGNESFSEKEQDVLNHLKQINIDKSKIEKLRKIFKDLETKKDKKILANMNLILKESRTQYIDFYIDSILEIAKKHEEEKDAVVLEAKSEQKGFKGESKEAGESMVEGKVNSYIYGGLSKAKRTIEHFVDSDELDSIQDIEIDGKITSQEFISRLNSYKQKVQETAEFQKLSPEEQRKVLQSIDTIKTKIQDLQEIQLDFLNNKFDDYAEQIENQVDNGITKNIKVDFGDGNIITFKDSKQAFEFIKNLKKNAEIEFQDNLQTILEGTGNLLAKPLKFVFTDILSQPYKIAKKWAIDDILEDYDKDVSGIEWTWDIILAFLAVAGSINYTETLFRRILIDNLAKAELLKVNPFIRKKYDVYDKDGKKTSQKEKRFKKLIIPDYGRDSAPQFFPNTEDANLYNEYLQRLSILDKLEAKINTLDGEKKYVFQNELEKIKSYLNINTDTFYLKALALEKEMGLPKRLYWVFRNGILNYKFHYNFIPFFARGLAQEAATEFNTNDGKLKDKLEKGINYVFKDTNVKIGEKGEILGVEGDFKLSQNIESLKKYVELSPKFTEEQRIEILSNIDKFLEELKTRPLPEETVKSKLLAIIEGKILGKDSILKELDEKYFKEEDIDKLKREGITGWILDRWDGLFEKKDKFQEELIKKWGKVAPASLTWEKAMAIKFRDMVEKGLWEGSIEDLEEIFKMIDSGKLELNVNYPGKIAKIKILGDLIKNSFKYGLITGPKLTKLQRFLEYEKTSGLKNLIEDGNSFLDSVKKAKELFKKGELGENLRNIIELDNNRFPNEPENLEEEFKQMFDDLKTQIEAEKLTKEEAQLELIKLYRGFLTKAKTLSILDSLDGDTKKKENVKHFKELIETGKWFGTKKELQEEIRKLKADENYQVKVKKMNFPEGRFEKIIDLINKKGKKLAEQDFRNGKGIFEEGKFKSKSYEIREGGLARIFNYNDSNKLQSLNSELSKFLLTVEKGTVYTFKEFFENLNKVLGTNIKIDESITRASFRTLLRMEVQKFYESLSNSEKIKLIDFIKGLDKDLLDKTELPENIVKALDGKVDNIKSVIESLRKEFEDGVDKKRLEEIRRELTGLLREEGITEELKEEINNLKEEINNKLKVNSSQETRTSPETKEKMTPEEKIKKIDDLYNRAIVQAELEYDPEDPDKIEKLKDIYNMFDIENDSIRSFQGDIKKILNIDSITELLPYKRLLKRKLGILRELEGKGIIENLNLNLKDGKISYDFKKSQIEGAGSLEERLEREIARVSEPKFVKYLIKAIKHGAR